MQSHSILSYQGPLSFSTIDWLLTEFKVAAEDHDLSFKIYKKMISMMIEALENISKYSDQFQCNHEGSSGFCPSFQISRSDEVIEMEASNPVRKRDVRGLRSKIDQVNSQDSDALRKLYRSTMSNGEFTEKGGAGLGLIEMAKTAGSKLEYTFENLTKDYSLYTFRVSMSI
jgi:hypothetical protein